MKLAQSAEKHSKASPLTDSYMPKLPPAESVLSGNINQARIWMNGFFFKPLDIESCRKASEQRYT